MKRLILLICCVFMMLGCVTKADKLGRGESISSERGYVGAMLRDRTFQWFGFLWGSDFYMYLENLETEKDYKIRFDRGEKYTIYELPPGRYSVTLIQSVTSSSSSDSTGSTTTNTTTTVVNVPERLRVPFEVRPGNVTYLGNVSIVNAKLVLTESSYSYDHQTAAREIAKRYSKVNALQIVPLK